MGIFSTKAPVKVDSDLEGAVVASSEKTRLQTLKVLGENQESIRDSLTPGESVLCASHVAVLGVSNNLLLVTNRRTISMKKGSIKKELRHDEVAETKMLRRPSGEILVQIESEKALLDFNPNDPERWDYRIQVTVDTLRVAQEICAAVDQFLPSR
jgi:hypothetical protein